MTLQQALIHKKHDRNGGQDPETSPTAHRAKRVSIATQHTGSVYRATQESLTDPALAFMTQVSNKSAPFRSAFPSSLIQRSTKVATRQTTTSSVETRRRAADEATPRQPAAGFITISDKDIYSDGWREDILPPYPELWLPPTHTRSIIASSFHKDSVTPKEERTGRNAKYHKREGSFVKMRWETNVHQDVFRFVDTYNKHAKQSDFELMKTKTELERERRYLFPTAALGPDPLEHINYSLEELTNLVKKEIRITNENGMRRRKNLKEIPSDTGMNVTKLDPITMEFLSEEDWNLVRDWRRLLMILGIPPTFHGSIANELPGVDLAKLVKNRYERGEDEYGREVADRNPGESESSTSEDEEIMISSDGNNSSNEGDGN
ncbi:MAG: hypothetical protein M1840_004370 [Geoglossum simile]|nr:MAG: hypothetical protein M1840_004370 [Geoglossum simile]